MSHDAAASVPADHTVPEESVPVMQTAGGEPATSAAPLMAGGVSGVPADAAPPEHDAGGTALPVSGNTDQEEAEAAGDRSATDARPVNYREQLKLPEDFTLNEDWMRQATDLFGEVKLPLDQAQKFLDTFCAMQRETAVTQSRRSAEAVQGWRRSIEERPGYREELPLVRLGIQGLSADFPELRDLFNDPVFGNMPELWKIALSFGRRFQTEGALLSGDRSRSPGSPSLPELLYPSMQQ